MTRTGASRFPAVLALGALVLLAVLAGGCANYHLGAGGTLKFSRLYIAPVKVEALIPQAEALVTTQLREAFAKDGRVTLADNPGDADATLTVVLAGYQRDVTVAQSQDTGLARRFEVSLRARVTLTDAHTNHPYFSDRTITAHKGVFVDSGLQQSEYQTLPVLAEALADDVVHSALDVW
ncbi:MAG TPA: LPS assembly lipoprotein LptE [Candidatus Didemnitutus sp.]|nr:LPS assembly lipoprotein LptE [Candidatus Didemnitutus sp.]